MDHATDDLYPHWVRLRDALQSTLSPDELRRMPRTCGDLAVFAIEALRPQLANDTVEMTRLLHVGATEAGWDVTLRAFARLSLDAGYPVKLTKLHQPAESRDGWALTHALLVELPTGQVAWRLTKEQALYFAGFAVALSWSTFDGGWDGHARDEKYASLKRFAERP